MTVNSDVDAYTKIRHHRKTQKNNLLKTKITLDTEI